MYTLLIFLQNSDSIDNFTLNCRMKLNSPQFIKILCCSLLIQTFPFLVFDGNYFEERTCHFVFFVFVFLKKNKLLLRCCVIHIVASNAVNILSNKIFYKLDLYLFIYFLSVSSMFIYARAYAHSCSFMHIP